MLRFPVAAVELASVWKYRHGRPRSTHIIPARLEPIQKILCMLIHPGFHRTERHIRIVTKEQYTGAGEASREEVA